jgi:hypothetical protein
LDYGRGTHLAKWQWDELFDPALLVSPFEGDEGGMSQQNFFAFPIAEVIDLNTYNLGNKINYITPDGRVITFDKSVKPSFTGVVLNHDAINKTLSKGVLLGFNENGKTYSAVFINDKYFKGYYLNGNYSVATAIYPVEKTGGSGLQKVLTGIEQEDCNLQLKTFDYTAAEYFTGKTDADYKAFVTNNIVSGDAGTIGQILIGDCHYTAKGKEVIAYLSKNGFSEYTDLVNQVGKLVSQHTDEKYDDYLKIATAKQAPNVPLSQAGLETFYSALETYYKTHEQATLLTDANCPSCPKYPVERDAYWDDSGRNWVVENGKWLDLSGEFIANTSWKSGVDVQAVHRHYYEYKLHLQETHPLTVLTGYTDKELFKKHLWRNTQFASVHLLKEQWAADQVGSSIWIPVYGSLKKAYELSKISENDMMLQTEAAFQTVFGISDVFLVKAVATGLFKLTAWAGGKMIGQDIVYLAKKQMLTARLSFILSTEAPLEATTFLNKQGDNIIEIISKADSRFIRYDLSTGELLVCSYSDDAARTLELSYEDFQKITINTAGKSEDEIVRAVVSASEEIGTKVTQFTQQQIDDYVKLATKNPDAGKVMLGKYDEPGTLSYIERAGTDHTYFDLGVEKWDEAKKIVDNNIDESWKSEMWRINKEFINQQKKFDKDFYLSHEPWKSTTKEFFSKEAEYLIDLGAKDFLKINDNTWKVIW